MSTKQIVTTEFAAWLSGTSFAGIVKPGEQWDTTEAWPSPLTMQAARACYVLFHRDCTALAEQRLWDAQRAFV